jgi:hypothetical protein
MKLKDFKKLFKKLPPDTEVCLVKDWCNADQNGSPLLCSANSIEVTCEEPQGVGDDGCFIVYIF